MSWLSDAWHGIENVVSDVGSWAASNESWLLPVALGVGAVATGGLLAGALAPELLGGAAAAEAGGEAAAAGGFGGELLGGAGAEAFGEGAAGIEAGIGGTAADVAAAEAIPSAVDITVAPWTGAALEGGTEAFAGGSLDTLLGGGAAGIEGGVGGVGTDVAALEAADEGGLIGVGGGDLTGVTAGGGVSDVPLAGELPDVASPAETVAGRFPLPDTGEAMPTGGTFSQAAPAAQAIDTALTTGGGGSASAAGDIGASSISTGGGAGAGGFNLGGLGKGIEGALGSPWVKYGLPLGVIGAQFLRGPGQLPPQERGAIDLANQQATFGATQLQLAQQGQILPAQQAQIDQWVQGQKNQLYQLYASRGIDPHSSTDFAQASAQIDAQALAQRSAIIQTMIQNGLSFETAASNTLTGAAQQQVSLDNAFNQSMSSALSSFGMMAALSGGRGGNVTINAPPGSTVTPS